MNRIDRLFGILLLLQSKKYVSADAIAEKYQISIRTVYRDIKTLSEQGIPVSLEQPKGYFIVQGFFIPPVAFTSDEANALMLMEHLVSAFSDASIKKHYASALLKVKAVMRPSQKETMERLVERMKHQFPARFNNESDYLSAVQNAMTSGNVLKVEYKNTKDEISLRSIEPIGLIFYAFAWHLIAWCQMRKDYRDFKISRILSITQTDGEFGKKDHLSIGDYMKQLLVEY